MPLCREGGGAWGACRASRPHACLDPGPALAGEPPQSPPVAYRLPSRGRAPSPRDLVCSAVLLRFRPRELRSGLWGALGSGQRPRLGLALCRAVVRAWGVRAHGHDQERGVLWRRRTHVLCTGSQRAGVLQTAGPPPAWPRPTLRLHALSAVGVGWARALSAGGHSSVTRSGDGHQKRLDALGSSFPRAPGAWSPPPGALLLSASSWKLAQGLRLEPCPVRTEAPLGPVRAVPSRGRPRPGGGLSLPPVPPAGIEQGEGAGAAEPAWCLDSFVPRSTCPVELVPSGGGRSPRGACRTVRPAAGLVKTVSFCSWLLGAVRWPDYLFSILVYSQKPSRRTGFGSSIR